LVSLVCSVLRFVKGRVNPSAWRSVVDRQSTRVANTKKVAYREAFLTAIRRVGLFSDPSTARIQLAISHDSIELSAHSEEYGDAREDMPVTSSDAITLGFNAGYLTDALTSMDSEQVRVEMKDPLAAAVFRPVDRSDYTHLIMPMRLQ